MPEVDWINQVCVVNLKLVNLEMMLLLVYIAGNLLTS
jgi:hypothetical protein